jgi:RES domain-containing protein
MATAWRLIKTKFASTPLSSDGARLYGGRWNSPGVAVVYFAESISLAVLEILVHLEVAQLLEAYSLVRIDFDPSAVRTLPAAALPASWADFPAPEEVRAIGDSWVESAETLLLRVPSAIVPLEHLFVLNPDHPARQHLAVAPPVPFRLDPRFLP